MNNARLAVIGVRNFADTHIKNIKKLEKEGIVRLVAVVAIEQIKNAERINELKKEGIEVFSSFDQLLREGKDFVDVIVLPTSIHSHAELAIRGMKDGYNILLEKPPAATIDELDSIIKTEKETGRFCSIGFQFIHSRSIRRLKDFIVDGKLGTIKELACKGYWPRYKSYYERNSWAGKTIWNGRIVLDGPMHNGLAHFLNNMLFLASPNPNESAELKSVRAELYRAHTYIKSDDTSCLEAETKDGVKIYFYVTHAPKDTQDPYMEIIGTKGKVYWNFNEDTEIHLDDDEIVRFDNDGIDPWLEVIRITAKTHIGLLDKPYSTPENSRNFIIAINGSYESAKKIRPIPHKYVREYVTKDNEYKTELKDIDNIMDTAFKERKLLSDLGVEWAHRTESINVEDYTEFNPFVERG